LFARTRPECSRYYLLHKIHVQITLIIVHLVRMSSCSRRSEMDGCAITDQRTTRMEAVQGQTCVTNKGCSMRPIKSVALLSPDGSVTRTICFIGLLHISVKQMAFSTWFQGGLGSSLTVEMTDDVETKVYCQGKYGFACRSAKAQVPNRRWQGHVSYGYCVTSRFGKLDVAIKASRVLQCHEYLPAQDAPSYQELVMWHNR
jgi:hypothetical protein